MVAQPYFEQAVGNPATFRGHGYPGKEDMQRPRCRASQIVDKVSGDIVGKRFGGIKGTLRHYRERLELSTPEYLHSRNSGEEML